MIQEKEGRKRTTFPPCPVWVRRDEVARKEKLPDREQIIRRMWRLANAGAGDAVKLACFPPEEWCATDQLELDALTEFKRGSNGVVELLDAVDHSGEEQVDLFLQAMEEQGG